MRRQTSPAHSHNHSKVPKWYRSIVRACSSNRNSTTWWPISWKWSSVVRRRLHRVQSPRVLSSIDLKLASGLLHEATWQTKKRRITTCMLISVKKLCLLLIQTTTLNKGGQRLLQWRSTQMWKIHCLSSRGSDRGSGEALIKIATISPLDKSWDKISAIKS